MSSRSRAVTVIRTLAGVTLALYAVVVVLLVLTIVFPHWGEDPHAVRQPGDDFYFYLPPQFFAAVYALLGAFGLAALAGVAAAATRSRAARRAGWAVALRVLTGLAVQGVVVTAVAVYGRVSLSATVEIASLAVSLLAFLLLPVAALVATRGARSAGQGAGG